MTFEEQNKRYVHYIVGSKKYTKIIGSINNIDDNGCELETINRMYKRIERFEACEKCNWNLTQKGYLHMDHSQTIEFEMLLAATLQEFGQEFFEESFVDMSKSTNKYKIFYSNCGYAIPFPENILYHINLMEMTRYYVVAYQIYCETDQSTKMELKKLKKKSGGFSYNFDDIFTVIINDRIGGIDFVLNLLEFIDYQMINIPNAWSFIDFYSRKADSFRFMGRSGMTNNQYLNDLFQKYRAIKRCRIINEIIS